MRIPRVYSPQTMAIGDCIELEAGAARHLTSALRMTSGQLITLFNGQGGEYVAELVEAKKGKAGRSRIIIVYSPSYWYFSW